MTEIEIAEAQSLASPWDWPADFHQAYGWNACVECHHLFLGIPTRIQCRACCGKEIE